MNDHRLGRFTLTRACIDQDRDAARLVMSACIVVRAEMRWAEDAIDYTAISPHFEAVPEGNVIPIYEWEISCQPPMAQLNARARRAA